MLQSGTREVVPALPIPLVVDDDTAVLNSLKFVLQLEGFTVRLYGSAQELLDELELPESGCLLVDHYMPGMSGLELLAALRRRGVTLPAILITGHPSVALRRRAEQVGVRLLEKPLLGNGLIEAIGDELGR
jgi:two-component system, LuxR family, response regulator FixJ